MKSLSFTVPGMFDVIIDGRKTITIRGLNIPRFVHDEKIFLKERLGNWRDKHFGRVATAIVNLVKPIQLKDITDEIARKEGFNNAVESREWLSKQYGLKDERQWLFAIGWRDVQLEPEQEKLF